ncbi:MAG: hypothetical protein Pg6A_04880 [Termitinemataceae bacterium]|jgi:protein TonB|nr:MAG: hypothetical protein Pg6A_04880 [Termitinemataceae bacterium]
MRANYRSRALVFAIVAGIHILAIFFIAFTIEVELGAPPETADVIKIVDLDEAPPPPPPETPVQQTVTDAIAETLIETETVPDVVATAAPDSEASEVYLSQAKISKMPRFNEKELLSRLSYPSIAQRSGIEQGTVYLELFVNRHGQVTRINVLREDPEGRGFAEAAIRAFTGVQATPAEANGQIVAARIRYPVRFQLR